jgi:hypothetical protein
VFKSGDAARDYAAMANVLLLLVGDDVPLRLRDAVASHVDAPARIHVVAPAQVRPLDWLATADDAAQREAEVRALEAEWTLADEGEVEGGAGDVDPVQAVEDALRSFCADEIVVAGAAADSGLEARLRRFGLPVVRLAAAPAARRGPLARAFHAFAAGRSEAVPFAAFLGVNVALAVLGVLLSLLVALIVWVFF